MPEKKKKFEINKRHFTFFGGIALCLLAVVLILNVGYPARALAFVFTYLFGLGSYAVYIFIYVYGMFLFFKEKGFKIKLNNIFFGSIVIFISALMIATLIVTRDDPINISTFMTKYKAVLYGIERAADDPSPLAYWNASFINLFQGNKFGGGLVGYALVGVFNKVFKTGGTWAMTIIILVLGLFIMFFPYVRKIIIGNKNKKPKVSKAKKTNEQEEEIGIVNSDTVIASARNLDRFNDEPSPILAQAQPQSISKPANFQERNELVQAPVDAILYTPGSNFSPAMFSKYQIKPAVEKVNVQQEVKMTGEEAILEANKQAKINEQMTLNFDEKPVIDEELVSIKPQFVNPEPVRPMRVEQPVSSQPINEQPVVKKPIKWVPPSITLLEDTVAQDAIDLNEKVAEERKLAINEVFEEFGVGAQCTSYVVGPSVTRYNIEYGRSVSLNSVEKLVRDISVRLGGVLLRFQDRVAGHTYSGLEIPNAKITTVSFKEVFSKLPDAKERPLDITFGKDIDGNCVDCDFDEFPHLLVAGTTGSGKSIFNHSVICTLISRNSPEDLKLVLIDPKLVEMGKYEDMPHLLCPIINDANIAKMTLSKLVDEMNRRYGILKVSGCSNIKQYEELRADDPSLEKLPYIIVFVDEFADLVDVCKDIKGPIVSLAQKARAAGIHMLIATQRPSANVIDGVIKGNLPSRVALAVASYTDSTVIINGGGAEKLLGKGDMLVMSPSVERGELKRLQSCFIRNKEILRIVGYLKEHYPTNYDPNFCNLEEAAAQAAGEIIGSPEFQASQENGEENKYKSVKEWVMANEYMSMSRIQRECGVGFNRAGRFFKRLQDEGVVATETDGNKGCPVLVHEKFFEGSAETDVPVSNELTD